MKKSTVLALVATVAIGFSGAAWAQETVGQSGEQVDGFGSGGNLQNQINPDGPNEGSWWLQNLHARSNVRTNSVQGTTNCDVQIRNHDCFKGSIQGDYNVR
jgi:hypothetical protein